MGSILGQLLHLTAAERRCLLVAGAAAGMTAVFGTPVAAVLLAVELLLFEWRPRSMIPVALAACSAEACAKRLSPTVCCARRRSSRCTLTARLPFSVTAGAVLVGVACGGLAWVMTRCVYGAEDLFGRLPLHWTWWPALGGFVVGVGGLIEPRVLGVGYETIGAELAGQLALGTLAVLLLVKLAVWVDRTRIEHQRRHPGAAADTRRRARADCSERCCPGPARAPGRCSGWRPRSPA